MDTTKGLPPSSPPTSPDGEISKVREHVPDWAFAVIIISILLSAAAFYIGTCINKRTSWRCISSPLLSTILSSHGHQSHRERCTRGSPSTCLHFAQLFRAAGKSLPVPHKLTALPRTAAPIQSCIPRNRFIHIVQLKPQLLTVIVLQYKCKRCCVHRICVG